MSSSEHFGGLTNCFYLQIGYQCRLVKTLCGAMARTKVSLTPKRACTSGRHLLLTKRHWIGY